MIGDLLDRYLLREWLKIFGITVFGFPVLVTLIDLTDNLARHLSRGIEPSAILLGYVFSLPEQIFRITPAAVLFATVFAFGAMNRHSELAAAKAAGRSFHRMLVPVLMAATAAAVLAAGIGEVAPRTTRRQLELHGELQVRSRASRQNLVYRADQGWVYTLRSLNVSQKRMNDLVLEREGSSNEYPTLVIQARRGLYNDSTARWMLGDGRFRMLSESKGELAVVFDSLWTRSLDESPAELLVEPKKPEEMTYSELGRYITALERSGGDGRQLTVQRALKIAVPATCIIIALFGAPLAVTSPRASGAFGVAISLGTTVFFLMLIQLSQGVATSGMLPPTLAAWIPNILFGLVGLWLLKKAPT